MSELVNSCLIRVTVCSSPILSHSSAHGTELTSLTDHHVPFDQTVCGHISTNEEWSTG